MTTPHRQPRKTVRSLEGNNPFTINLNDVIRECYPGASVDASSTSITIRIPGELEIHRSHSDTWRRIAQWICMVVALPFGVFLESAFPVIHSCASFCLGLGVIGSLAVLWQNDLRRSFASRVVNQVTLCAGRVAEVNHELLTEAMLAFWAIRDTRPALANVFQFWGRRDDHNQRSDGSNSVAWSLLTPIQKAMQSVADRIVNGESASWSRIDLYQQKFEAVAAKIPNFPQNSGFEAAWWRTVVIPFKVTAFFRNLGWTGFFMILFAVLITGSN